MSYYASRNPPTENNKDKFLLNYKKNLLKNECLREKLLEKNSYSIINIKNNGEGLIDYEAYKNCKFASKLKEILNSLPTGNEILEEEIGYQFPDGKFLNTIKLNYDSIPVNRNKEDIDFYISELIDGSYTNKKHVVTGDVGVGKSEFTKYIHVKIINKIKNTNHKIIPIRIAYENIATTYDGSLNKKNDWVECFENEVISLILFQFICLVKKTKWDVGEYRSWALQQIKRKNNKEGINYIDLFNDYFESESIRDHTIRGDYDKYIKTKILLYLKDSGFNFFIIVDGFDRFSLGQMIKPKQKMAFSALGDYIFLNKALLLKEYSQTLVFSMLVTLRNCTYNYYPREDSYESCKDQPKRRYLAPVGIHKIIRRSVNYYCYENKDVNEDTREKMISSLISIMEYIRDSLGFHNKNYPEDIISLFNNNYRRFNRFLIAVISDLLSHLEKKEKIKSSEEQCVAQLSKLTSNNRFIKGYYKKEKVLQLFVLSGKKSYNNYYSYGRTTFDDGRHRVDDNREKHGLIDNIFDYDDVSILVGDSYINENGCSMLLVKLRILQFISLSEGQSSNAQKVSDFLLKLGYSEIASIDKIEDLLDKLSKSSFIKSSKFVVGNSLITYRITALGEFVIKLVKDFELGYIENVIQKTLLPEFVRYYMLPASKYASQIYNHKLKENGMAGLTLAQHWVFSSTLNSLIFFQYALGLESLEKKHMRKNFCNITKNRSFYFFHRILQRSNLKPNSSINRYSCILDTPVSYLYINTKSLHKEFSKFLIGSKSNKLLNIDS